MVYINGVYSEQSEPQRLALSQYINNAPGHGVTRFNGSIEVLGGVPSPQDWVLVMKRVRESKE